VIWCAPVNRVVVVSVVAGYNRVGVVDVASSSAHDAPGTFRHMYSADAPTNWCVQSVQSVKLAHKMTVLIWTSSFTTTRIPFGIWKVENSSIFQIPNCFTPYNRCISDL